MEETKKCGCPGNFDDWCGELFDARGIYCCKICDRCEKKKRAEYDPRIFNDGNYGADERIEPDGPDSAMGDW